jgi:uncharacterized protein
MSETGNAYDAEGTGEIRLTLNSGRRIDLRTFGTEAGDFRIEDIAHALSNLCRFAGHVPKFYSVAQHSILVSDLLPEPLKFAGLMHDAGEAYLVDLPHFIKHAPELRGYLTLEKELEAKLFPAFELPYPFDPRVKHADRTATDFEWKQFMRNEPSPLIARIDPMNPVEAKRAFLQRYRELAGVGLRRITLS